MPVGAGFSGGLVADGTGEGAVSGATLFVGSGNGGALLALGLGAGLDSASGSTEASTLAAGLAFAFTFAGEVIVPPEGIPSSLRPVGGCAGCTG